MIPLPGPRILSKTPPALLRRSHPSYLEDLGAINAVTDALSDNLGGEHEVVEDLVVDLRERKEREGSDLHPRAMIIIHPAPLV